MPENGHSNTKLFHLIRTASTFRAASCVVFVLVLLLLWLPPVLSNFVQTPAISMELIEAARKAPSDEMLERITELQAQPSTSKEDPVPIAEEVLRGGVTNTAFSSIRITLPFAADDLDNQRLENQLFIAQLGVPKLLLRGYEASGRKVFLQAAADAIVQFAKFERSAWFDKGLLWNDHAIAERMHVLVEFWKVYRKNPDFRPEVARVILEHAARCGGMLAKSSRFTFSTNHGLMQNLALVQGSVAFSSLPFFNDYRALALQRIQDQMSFYMSEEGVILEHSASYQVLGLQLLTQMFWYMTIIGEPIPTSWTENYARAKEFYSQLRRPSDGSLPLIGDTGNGDDPGPLAHFLEQESFVILDRNTAWDPPKPASLYGVSGYSIWWDGLSSWPDLTSLAQTVITWSYFPGHAHKHADEMSVLLWAGGQNWWTNVGYWPYGLKGREKATSWEGSNAPHRIGESEESFRKARLLAYGNTENVSAIDMERRGPGDYVARRQVIRVTPNIWLVIDRMSGRGGHQIVWSTSHSITLRPAEIAGSYILSAANGDQTLTVFPFGSDGTLAKHVEGNWQPFGGWEVDNGKPVPTSALMIENGSAEAWSCVVWQLNRAGEGIQLGGFPKLTWGQDTSEWTMQLPTKAGEIEVRRDRNRILLSSPSPRVKSPPLSLSIDPGIEDKVAQIRKNFAEIERKYQIPLSVSYRTRVTCVALLAFLIQEFLMFRLPRFTTGHVYIREFMLLLWVIGAILIAFFFNETIHTIHSLETILV